MIIKLNPRRVDIGAIAAIAGVILVAYVVLFHQGITHYFSLKAQEKILRGQLGEASTISQALLEFQQAIRKTETSLQSLNKRLPAEKNIDDILQQITQASSETRVTLRLIEPMDVIEGEMYKRLPIKMYVEGAFQDCFSFFRQLESLKRILQLENLKIDKKAGAENITIEMVISAFMLK